MEIGFWGRVARAAYGPTVRVAGLVAASFAVTLMLVGDGGLSRLVLLRDFIGVGYYQYGYYGYSTGDYYGAYGLPCGPTTPTPGAFSSACVTATETPTATVPAATETPTTVATETPTPTVPAATETPTAAASTGGESGGGGGAAAATAVPATEVPATAVAATSTAQAQATGTARAQATVQAQVRTTTGPSTQATQVTVQPGASVTVTLANGQQVLVQIPADLAAALAAAGVPAGSRLVVSFNPAPQTNVSITANGGGNTAIAGQIIDIKIGLVDANGVPLTTPEALLDLVINVVAPAIDCPAGSECDWVIEFRVNGEAVGLIRYTNSTYDPATNTKTFPLTIGQASGTLFVPVRLIPAYLQNFDPDAHIWSGPTDDAVDFGAAGPQFTTFTVVAPQVLGRILVFNPVTANYGWIDTSGVGPSGPPTG